MVETITFKVQFYLDEKIAFILMKNDIEKKGYRAVLLKWEFFIKMRVAESRPSFNIEESWFSKNVLFLSKNDFLFYYLKL